MKKGHFDTAAFFAALNGQRVSQKLTWKEVSKKTGVSASTLTRMAQGRRPDVDGLAALCLWSGLNANDFIRERKGEKGQPTSLAMMSAHLRADPHLSDQSAIALEQVLIATYEHLTKGSTLSGTSKRIQKRSK